MEDVKAVAEPLSTPCELMPYEMTISAKCVRDVPGVHLLLGNKDGTWAIGGSGATLEDAAKSLFKFIADKGGVPKAMNEFRDHNTKAGFKFYPEDYETGQSQLAGLSDGTATVTSTSAS